MRFGDKPALKILLAVIGLVVCAVSLSAGADNDVLAFTRLDLTDGRKLKNVVVKSYDAKSDRLLVVVDRKAMMIPVALLPAPVRERFRQDARQSGETVSEAPARQAPVVRPSTAKNTMPSRAGTAVPNQDAAIAAHRAVALARAEKYFRYEHQTGSNSIKVTALDFETARPRPVPGWDGRYETTGKAFLEFYDSTGGSFQRTTATFSVLTEQKPGQDIEVVGFDKKV